MGMGSCVCVCAARDLIRDLVYIHGHSTIKDGDLEYKGRFF